MNSLRRILALGVTLLVTQTSLAQSTFDETEYRALTERSDALYEEAQALPQDALEERNSLLLWSAVLAAEALQMVREGVLLGPPEAFGEDAREDLFRLYHNVIVTFASVGDCRVAEDYLVAAFSYLEFLPDEASEILEEDRGDIVECYDRRWAAAVADASNAPAHGEGSFNVSEISHVRSGSGADEVDVVPFVLMGSGAALIAGGVVYELALAADLDEYQHCSTLPTCNEARRQELQRDLDGAKPVIGLLLSAGIFAGISGIVALLTGDSSNDQGMTVAPLTAPAGYGALISLEY